MLKEKACLIFTVLAAVFAADVLFSAEKGSFSVDPSSSAASFETEISSPVVKEKQVFAGRIEISGNRAFPADRIRSVMGTQEKVPLDMSVLEEDIKNVLAMYREAGYPFARIDETELVLGEDEERIYNLIQLSISEGNKFIVGKIDIEGNRLYPRDFIRSMMRMKEGEPFDRNRWEAGIESILSSYHSDGFPSVIVRPAINLDMPSCAVNIALKIDEGKRGQITKIEVEGNRTTKPQIITREMRVKPGDYYSEEKIAKMKTWLTKLPFVRVENIDFVPGETEGQLTMIVKVQELKTNSIYGVVGYNPPKNEGEKGTLLLLADVYSLSLFGTARQFNIHAETKEDRENYEFGYTEPWIFGEPVTMNFRVREEIEKNRTWNNQTYEYDKIEGGFLFITSFSRFFDGSFMLGEEQTRVNPDNIPGLKGCFKVKFGLGTSFNTLDYPSNPSSGFADSLSVELGLKESTTTTPSGTVPIDNVTKIKLSVNHFFEVWKDKVFSVRFMADMVSSNKEIPDYEYYRLGGANNLRGYMEDQFRGTGSFVLSNEFRFITGQDSHFFVFCDAGLCTVPGESVSIRDMIDGTGGGIGYGFGLRSNAGPGIISVSFAMSHKDNIMEFLSSAKVHATFETRF